MLWHHMYRKVKMKILHNTHIKTIMDLTVVQIEFLLGSYTQYN